MGSTTIYAVAAYLLGVLAVFLAVVVAILAYKLMTLKEELGAAEAAAEAQSPKPATEQSLPRGAFINPAAELKGDDALEAIEEAKLAIQGLLRILAENVSGFMQSHASYDSRLEGHKVAIQKATTLASLEEIERRLLMEIEELRTQGRQYRQQLDEANAKIREQNEVIAQIQAEAWIDYLTKLPNRRAFEGRLNEELERGRRYSRVVSLIILDIDHFKKVNDTWGHPTGDKLLQMVALLLHKNVRVNDFVSRFGGEEFAVILPETSLNSARSVAEKLRLVVEQTGLQHDKESIKVTVSLGVGEAARRDETIEKLVAKVDAALYQAKQNGRNRVEAAQ